MFWYRRGKIEQLLYSFDMAKKWYEKCLDQEKIKKTGRKEIAYQLRGLGEVALLHRCELNEAENKLGESLELFKKAFHRGWLWIMRSLAEIKRQRAIQACVKTPTGKKLLAESESEYEGYINECEKMANPNGLGWGWICLGFLYLTAEFEKIWEGEKRKRTSWECLCKAEEIFKKTKSLLGQLEVAIGKGLALVVGLCPKEVNFAEIINNLKKVQTKARNNKLRHQEELLGKILKMLHQGTEAELPKFVSEEIFKPRNPA
jgi:tetratricopeptide (TPR) repeat protein